MNEAPDETLVAKVLQIIDDNCVGGTEEHPSVNADVQLLDILELATPALKLAEPFQQRVAPWMEVCFGPEISNDRLERGDRLLEEVLEALQSGDYPRDRVAALTAYTYGREKGEPHQEIGGVMVTLAAYCLAHGIDMHQAAEDELARIWTKVDKIRAKQAAKPTGSALPIAVLTRAPIDANELWEMLFAITKDSVPEGLTDEVLGQLADRLNELIAAEVAR